MRKNNWDFKYKGKFGREKIITFEFPKLSKEEEEWVRKKLKEIRMAEMMAKRKKKDNDLRKNVKRI